MGVRMKNIRVDYCRRARKVAFTSELDAKMALADRSARDKGEIRYYKCKFCPHYHLTSEKQRDSNHGE